MVYSIGRKGVYETEPDNEVIDKAAWKTLSFLRLEEVDMAAKGLGGNPLGQGYTVDPATAPKAVLWKSKSKLPPDYALGNNEVMLVSSRFRDLAERFEPGVHQFLPVSMYHSKKDSVPFDTLYWFVARTLIDSLDRNSTTLTYRGSYDSFRDDGFRKGHWYFDSSAVPRQRPVYSISAIGDRHIWRDPYYNRNYAKCSDAFGEAVIAAELTGFGLLHYEQV